MASSIGIYVGTESIDLVTLSGSFQNPKLAGFARVKLPDATAWRSSVRIEGVAADPSVQVKEAASPESLLAPIQALISKIEIPPKQPIHVGIAAESVVIRYFQMPSIPPHERKMAVSFEAKKYLPFKLDELITDYQAVIRGPDKALMRVMFFGLKRNASTLYELLFQPWKQSLESLEPSPVSLMRLARQTEQFKANQAVAIISMEQDSATISIARDDMLYLSRNVSILENGISPAGGNGAELLDALVNETRVSIDYYRRRFLGEPAVAKILVYGKSDDKTRMEGLSGALDLPVEQGDPFRKIAGAQAVPDGLSVAVGLALKGLGSKKGQVNLLPPAQRVRSTDIKKPLIAELLIALTVITVWYTIASKDIQTLEHRKSILHGKQTHPENVRGDSNNLELRELKNQLEKERAALNALAERKQKVSQLMEEITWLLPQEAWLRSAVIKEIGSADAAGRAAAAAQPHGARHMGLQITGGVFADNRDTELQLVNEFLAALQKNELLKSCFTVFSLDSAQRGTYAGEEITEFKITCAFNADEARQFSSERIGSYSQGGRRS